MYKFKIAGADDIIEINSRTDRKMPVSAIYIEGVSDTEILSACVFALRSGYSEIIDLLNFDASETVLSATLKSALNFIDLYGIKKVVSSNGRIKKDLISVGFKESGENEYSLSLEGYFEGGCRK